MTCLVFLINLVRFGLFILEIAKIFEFDNDWYINRNGNYYNPVLDTTVYSNGKYWNFARYNHHYTGYGSHHKATQALQPLILLISLFIK